MADAGVASADGPAVTKGATERVQIAVTIDQVSMVLKIPPRTAAFVVQDEWSYGLAVDASDRAPGGSTTVSVVMLPKATDPQTISRAKVVKDATLTKVLAKPGDVLTIVPGKEFPAAHFGAAPPKVISIRLAPST